VFPLPAVAVRGAFGAMGEAVLLEGQRVLPARLLGAGFAFAEPELDSALAQALGK
jgi:NAD dependent epimerase/dehydratase family enzyme